MDRQTDGIDAVEIDRQRGVTVLSFSSPILSLDVLDELCSTLEALVAKKPNRPLVLRSTHPSVFQAGAHLAEIANLDASSSGPRSRTAERSS